MGPTDPLVKGVGTKGLGKGSINFRDISSSFVLLLSWFNLIGKMWIIGVTRGKTRSNAKLSVSEDAFITKPA